MAWEQAWATTVETLGYTNHTLLPEALERWPMELMERVLPRHLQIIQEINRRLVADVERRFPGDVAMAQRVSIFGDQRSADGEPRDGGEPLGQRRRRAALGAREDDARSRLQQALSRALQQQDERRDAAALAAAREPSAGVR